MRMRNVGFLTKKPKKLVLDAFLWRMIHSLTQAKYPLQEALEITCGKKEEIMLIKGALSKGEPLSKVIDVFFEDSISKKLPFLLGFLPWGKALEVAIEMELFQENIKTELRKALLYPVSLFLFSWMVLVLFTFKILPSVVYMLDMQSQSQSLLVTLRCIQMAMGIFVVFLLSFFWIMMRKYHQHAYGQLERWLNPFHLTKVISLYLSYTYCEYLCDLARQGLSTKEAVEVLVHYSQFPWMMEVAAHMKEGLNRGEFLTKTMEYAFLDELFLKMAKMGISSGRFLEALEEYSKLAKMNMEKYMKQFTILVQCLAYGSIGAIVILVYQMMLYPLQMLEQL